jgi:hypothetical protein
LTVSKLTITGSRGLSVEIYGTQADQLPPAIGDPAWVHLASGHSAKRHTRLALDSVGRQFRHLVVWVTEGPPSGVVKIAEVALFR